MKVPAFNGMWKLTATSTRTCYWSPSSARWIQYISSHPIPLRSILLILSSYLHLCLPNSVFPWGFLGKTLHALLSSHMNITCPTHLTTLIGIISGKEHKSWSTWLFSFLQLLVILSCLCPIIFLCTLLSNTLMDIFQNRVWWSLPHNNHTEVHRTYSC